MNITLIKNHPFDLDDGYYDTRLCLFLIEGEYYYVQIFQSKTSDYITSVPYCDDVNPCRKYFYELESIIDKWLLTCDASVFEF